MDISFTLREFEYSLFCGRSRPKIYITIMARYLRLCLLAEHFSITIFFPHSLSVPSHFACSSHLQHLQRGQAGYRIGALTFCPASTLAHYLSHLILALELTSAKPEIVAPLEWVNWPSLLKILYPRLSIISIDRFICYCCVGMNNCLWKVIQLKTVKNNKYWIH